MDELHVDQFPQFFFELHGREAFPWQRALAEQVCKGGWPQVIDLPTASGKTACIDIALFALALRGGDAPRRIFFVVDRRVVVNEAYLRMCSIRDKLAKARTGVLGAAAGRLRDLASEDSPLDVYEMRGGAYRDETWVRNPLQPTVVASTVDQVGSRLLFRGYGVSEDTWPIHAGLIGNDALIILDEAHCSKAFAQTLESIEQYRSAAWATNALSSPFHFVEMTATPSRTTSDSERFVLRDRDRSNETLQRRLRALKPTRLREVKGRKDDFANLGEELISQAIELSKSAQAKRIAIFVNRVGTAKLIYKKLCKDLASASVELVIGRMRALDRDELYRTKLQRLKSGEPRRDEDPLTFVVSTQCLEVGADLDFDVVVSECASIDALQQRFGRLDRLGDFGRAAGAIVMGSWQVSPKQPDPVYGDALAKTWEWLKSIGGAALEVNMGIESPDATAPTVAEQLKLADSGELRMQGESAPILLPAHVDAFVQTSPAPEPDPLVELFLHGPKRGAPDVQVLWRSDLGADPSKWKDIVALCPPSSRETMPVQIYAFKKWFAGEKNADANESDLETGSEEPEPRQTNSGLRALAWGGDGGGGLISHASQIKPGQTLILSETAGGWNELGHIPDGAAIDVGDRAAFGARKSVSLRLHPEVMKYWPVRSALAAVETYAATEDAESKTLEELLKAYLAELNAIPGTDGEKWPHAFLTSLASGQLRAKELNAYPDRNHAHVFEARLRSAGARDTGTLVLEDHLGDVERAVARIAVKLAGEFEGALETTARFHDYGKIDMRYQAWLRGGDLLAAQYAPRPLAKSGSNTLGRQTAVGLPKGFRHELLSFQFAERGLEAGVEHRDLILHLIASHHGKCRPFAPVVPDEKADCVSFGGISICRKDRLEQSPYRLDSGIADRFWMLTRMYGWWGLAYLEGLFRLADWRASGNEREPRTLCAEVRK